MWSLGSKFGPCMKILTAPTSSGHLWSVGEDNPRQIFSRVVHLVISNLAKLCLFFLSWGCAFLSFKIDCMGFLSDQFYCHMDNTVGIICIPLILYAPLAALYRSRVS